MSYRACHNECQCATVPRFIYFYQENGCPLPFMVMVSVRLKLSELKFTFHVTTLHEAMCHYVCFCNITYEYVLLVYSVYSESRFLCAMFRLNKHSLLQEVFCIYDRVIEWFSFLVHMFRLASPQLPKTRQPALTPAMRWRNATGGHMTKRLR